MNYPIQKGGVVIVAAGESKRLGIPKQLLPYQGETLLNRLIAKLKQATNFPIFLILGASAEKIIQEIGATDFSITINENWQEGMASSIRLGIQVAQKNIPDLEGILLVVCDQPFIAISNIQALIQLQQHSDLPIAACYYANTLGTPALFHKSIFPDLLQLRGDVGAKNIILQRGAEVAKLHFEEGLVDIDTPEDYQQLLASKP
ncbi:MAG: nucleotidyltransferase family protein [Bacteroidetes bacterium]|nr:nucleotidyltransferase family protein [Bacteroidota bacterium]